MGQNARVLGDHDKPGCRQLRVPALSAHPEAVLALVREVPVAPVKRFRVGLRLGFRVNPK